MTKSKHVNIFNDEIRAQNNDLHLLQVHAMALLRYMMPVHGLPDPRVSLSAAVSSQTISEAIKVVQEEVMQSRGKQLSEACI